VCVVCGVCVCLCVSVCVCLYVGRGRWADVLAECIVVGGVSEYGASAVAVRSSREGAGGCTIQFRMQYEGETGQQRCCGSEPSSLTMPSKRRRRVLSKGVVGARRGERGASAVAGRSSREKVSGVRGRVQAGAQFVCPHVLVCVCVCVCVC
jgi:hypothetical protein